MKKMLVTNVSQRSRIFSARVLLCVGSLWAAAEAAGQNLIANGGFETNTGNGSTPSNWVKDFNSYGAFTGAAHAGSWGLHPGNGAASGGEYQDIATVPGTTYLLTVWARNFGAAGGTSHLDVLVGAPGDGTYSFIFPGTATATTRFAPGVRDASCEVGASWQKYWVYFVAEGTTTRIGLYNSYKPGDTVHSINVDDITVEAIPGTLYWDTVSGDGAAITGGAGAWAVASTNWNVGSVDTNWVDGARAVFGGAAGGTVTLGTPVVAAGLQFDAAGYLLVSNVLTLAGWNPEIHGTASATISSQLGGAAGFVKSGTNAVTLTAGNSYTGTTTIRDGTLILSGPYTGNTTINGSIDVLTNGVLRWTVGHNIRDTATLTLTGGAADLQGNREFIGGLTLRDGAWIKGTGGWLILNGTASGELKGEGSGNAGTIAATMALASTAGNLKGNRTQTVNVVGGSCLTVTGSIINDPLGVSCTGSVKKVGSGTLVLSGDSTFSGGTVLEEGCLSVAKLSAFGIGEVRFEGGYLSPTGGARVVANAINVSKTGRFWTPEGGALAVVGAVTNSGGLLKTGQGRLVLNGSKMYSGETIVSEGLLQLSSAQGLPAPLIHYKFQGVGPDRVVTNYGLGGAALNGLMNTNSSVVVDPIFGEVLKVSTSGGYGGVTTMNNVTIGNQFTFAAWVGNAASASQWQRIVHNSFSASGYLGTDSSNPSRYAVIVKNNNNVSTQALETGWHFVAQVWDGVTNRFYYDGRLVSELGHSGINTSFTGPVGFGNNPTPNAEYWRGTLSDSFVFTNALTASQMEQLYLTCQLYGTAVSNVLPSTASLRVASGAGVDLAGIAQEVAALSGRGWVTGGTVRVTGQVMPGDTNLVTGSLSVQGGLTLATGVTNRVEYTADSADSVAVTGTLKLEGAGTVELSPIGAVPPPNTMTLFTFGALLGEEHLADWTVTGQGLSGKCVRLKRVSNSLVVTISPIGTRISFQ